MVKVLPVVIAHQIAIKVDIGDDVLPANRFVGCRIDKRSVSVDDRLERLGFRWRSSILTVWPGELGKMMNI
jgi:hypothetical protein